MSQITVRWLLRVSNHKYMKKDTSISKGMLWIAFQKFGTMTLSFFANILLARLLMPSDFGTLGILMSFVAFSEIFIDGGLISSLIQKGEPSQEEYSSVFIFNAFISLIFYIVLFINTQEISDFFEDDALIDTIPVIGIILLINSLSVIQLVKLQISLEFKKISLYNIIANLIGLLFGIVLALIGYGVWSLVYKTIVTQVVIMLLLWKNSNWFPSFHFSLKNIISLYKFGGYIFVSSLVEYVYSYLQPILIGKNFSMNELGYYTQARKIEEIPTNSLVSIVNTVTFPVYSKLSNDYSSLIENAQKTLTYLSFISIPIMFFLIVTSKYVILFLLGEKWIEAYPLLQILCISGIFRIPSGSNMNIIKSLGKSKTFMFVQIFKRFLGILSILISFYWGLLGLMWGFSIAGFLFFIIDSFVCGHYVKYGTWLQLIDMSRSLIISMFTGLLIYCFNYHLIELSEPIVLIIDILSYFTIYIILSMFFNSSVYNYFKEKVKSYINNAIIGAV